MSQILTDDLGQAFQLGEENPALLGDRECLFANVNTVAGIASFLRTSLGPSGMDKILVSPDGNVTTTNDGATILQEMEMSTNPISELVVQLSKSQDEEVGDGTTSIVILASALLQQAKSLVEKGVHPTKIVEGFSEAQQLVMEHFEVISEPISDLKGCMLKAAKTTLNSKIVAGADFAGICVDAVMAVADIERRDLDMDLISIQSKVGSNLCDTRLIKGIVLDKPFSHPQMKKEFKDAKIALLSCPFELPKLKTKNSLLIKSAEEYKALEKYEREKFVEMVRHVKDSGAEVVMCQWGFEDEANSLLLQEELPAVRWVGGHELGLMAAHISGQIVARFEDLTGDCLGTASVREETLTTESEKVIIVENAQQRNSVTILVRGSTEFVIKEAIRSIRDALCSVRNILCDSRIVYGGGSAEVSAFVFLTGKAAEFSAATELSVQAFAQALLEIPMALAENSGYESVGYVEKLREQQIALRDHTIGVDCLETGERSMKKVGVFESLRSKTKQIQMATALVNMILKINDMIKIE